MSKTLVFLVEDDSSIRESMKEFLEMFDFEVEDFENGKLAVERLEQVSKLPHILFLDLMMPVMNGWEFLKVALTKLEWAKLPIVVFSASPQDTSQLSPAVAFYKKPVGIDDFLSIIEKHRRREE